MVLGRYLIVGTWTIREWTGPKGEWPLALQELCGRRTDQVGGPRKKILRSKGLPEQIRASKIYSGQNTALRDCCDPTLRVCFGGPPTGSP